MKRSFEVSIHNSRTPCDITIGEASRESASPLASARVREFFFYSYAKGSNIFSWAWTDVNSQCKCRPRVLLFRDERTCNETERERGGGGNDVSWYSIEIDIFLWCIILSSVWIYASRQNIFIFYENYRSHFKNSPSREFWNKFWI